MRFKRIVRSIAVAIAIIMLVVALPASPANAAGPIYLDYTSGTVGRVIYVTGTGFTGASFTIVFGVGSGYQQTVYTGIPTLPAGDISASFAIPLVPRSTYTVQVTDTLGNTDSAGVTILPNIALNKTSDKVGGAVLISGNGFTASSTVSFYLGSTAMGTATATSQGTFNDVQTIVPEISHGSQILSAQDVTTINATTTFTVEQSVALGTSLGKVGDSVTITGKGFAASSSVTVDFGSTTVVTVNTSSNGSFTASFTVPAIGGGTYQVRARDSSSYEATANYTVSATASIGKTQGTPGSEVSVSGSGFVSSGTVSISLAGSQRVSVQANAQGGFQTTFLVPAIAAGAYKITISDGTNSAEFDFTVVIEMFVEPSAGHVGSKITVRGSGFVGSVSINYDGTEVAKATAQGDSSFLTTFNIPVSKSGAHRITASDATNSLISTFTLESAPPTGLQLLQPELGIKAKSETRFDWTDATDESLPVAYTLQVSNDPQFTTLALEKKGLTASEYTLTKEGKLPSTSQSKPYYWRVKAIDSASNESAWTGNASFYVGLILPDWANYAFIGLGVVLAFLLGVLVGGGVRRKRYARGL